MSGAHCRDGRNARTNGYIRQRTVSRRKCSAKLNSPLSENRFLRSTRAHRIPLWRYSCTVIRSSSTDPTSIPCHRTAVSIPCSIRLSETGCISMTNPEDSSARIRCRSAVARQFSSKSTGISRRTSGFRSSNVCERNGTVSTSSTSSTVSRKRTPVTSRSSSRRSNGS